MFSSYSDPKPTGIGRTLRVLSFLTSHVAKLKEAFEWCDRAIALLTVLLIATWIRHLAYPEWLRSTSEVIEIFGTIVITVYVILRLLLRSAKEVIIPPASFEDRDEGLVNWRDPCSPHVSVVARPRKSPEEYASDLEDAVRLCQETLGFEHDSFQMRDRWKLYDGWCKANNKAILLIKPKYGSAKDQPIGVIIILPLTSEGLPFMQDKHGGVLKLDQRHIFPAKRRLVPTLLIDTLLLKDQWIPEYGPLALKCLFHHVSMFYSPKLWIRTELYCCMHRGGAVGTYLPGMRKLIHDRGFQDTGKKTAEGETIFRLALSSLEADPLTKQRYLLYRRNLDICAEISID